LKEKKMSAIRLWMMLPLVLTGCVFLPHDGDIQAIMDDYDQTVEFAQSSIEYAQCLETIKFPAVAMDDPENEALIELIPKFSKLVLEEQIVRDRYVYGSDESIICHRDEIETERLQTKIGKQFYVTPICENQIIVTLPSFKTFIEESQSLQDSLRSRLVSGQFMLTGGDQELGALQDHASSLPRMPSMFPPYIVEDRHYLLTAYSPMFSIEKLATRISGLALQASYFSDDLDHQAIYECSKVSGVYDKRFNGKDGLNFDQAQASVDFSAMTESERHISTSEKLEEIYNRYDDAKDTIKTLEKLF